MFNFAEMMKQFGSMQGQMEQIKERMSRMKITGEAGAGLVKVTVNGESRVVDVKIDATLMGPDDAPVLEELIISATNDAMDKAKNAMAHEMKNIAGLNIPGIEKLFGG